MWRGNTLFLMLIFSWNINAQPISSFSFNAEFDFPFQTIFHIREALNGTMWFGTSEGLVSYNGISYRKYSNRQFGSSYTNISFDVEGRVWCANFSGQLFYLENDSLHLAYNFTHRQDLIHHYSVEGFPEIKILDVIDGKLWSFNFHGGDSSVSLDFSLDDFSFFGDYTTDRLNFLALRLNSKKRIDSCEVIGVEANKNSGYRQTKLAYLPKFQGKIRTGKTTNGDWIVANFFSVSEIYRINQDSVVQLFSSDSLNQYTVNQMLVIDNEIWILTDNGVYIVSVDTGGLIAYALPGLKTSTVHINNDGSIWVGTLGAGVHILLNRNIISDVFSVSNIKQMAFDGNRFLYAQDNSGYIWRAKAPFTSFSRFSREPVDRAPLFIDTCAHRMYVGHKDHFVDLKNGAVVNSLEESEVIYTFKHAASLCNGSFVATSYSLSYISSTRKDADRGFVLERVDSSSIRRYRSNFIALHHNSLYIDYVDGLIYYSKTNTPKKVRYPTNENIQTSFIIGDRTSQDLVWVTTLTHELLAIENGEIVKNISLPGLGRFIEVTDAYVFVYMKEGLFRYAKHSGRVSALGLEMGWSSSQALDFFEHQDTLWAISAGGIQKIAAKDFPDQTFESRLLFSDIKVKGLTIANEALISMSSSSNSLSFSLRPLSIARSRGQIFQYRFVGEDRDWVSVGSKNAVIQLLNLSPGKYSIEARACLIMGSCSESEVLSFSILPPFYLRWWFYILVVLLVSGGIGSFIYFYYRAKHKKNELNSRYEAFQKELYKSRIAALRAQMNPHFIFNALNTIQEFIITNKGDIASDYLADFADLMRLYLEQSSRDEVSLREEEELLRLYLRLEKMRLNNEIDIDFQVDTTLEKDEIMIPPMLLQPHIENSIKHGLLHSFRPKILKIRINSDAEGVVCVIEDNGVGREASQQINFRRKHKAFSTGANLNRVKLLNQMYGKRIRVDIFDLKDVDSGTATGTRVEIHLSNE